MRALGLSLAGVLATLVRPALADRPDDHWLISPSGWLGAEDFHYAETVTTPTGQSLVLDHYAAILPTARLELDVVPPRLPLFARAAVAVTSGDMRYYGFTQDLQTGELMPVVGTTSGWLLDIDLIAGARFAAGAHVLIGGFIGAGHHDWDRDLRGNAGGYLERYAWSYGELGVRCDVYPVRRLALALELAALAPDTGSLYGSHFADGIDDIHESLTLGVGVRGRLAAAYAITTHVELTALVAAELTSITRSSIVPLTEDGQPVDNGSGQPLYLSEPPSQTTRVTIAVGAAVRL